MYVCVLKQSVIKTAQTGWWADSRGIFLGSELNFTIHVKNEAAYIPIPLNTTLHTLNMGFPPVLYNLLADHTGYIFTDVQMKEVNPKE